MMRISRAEMSPSNSKNTKLRPARTGALMTAGVLGASTAISWVSKPDEMAKVVKECGGKSSYIKNYALGIVLLSGIGAAINTLLTAVTKKVQPKDPPKAVN